MDVQAYLSERSALTGEFLDKVVPPASESPQPLHGAMRHLLFPGGKRLRPAFAFAGCEALGGATEKALPVAAAVELVHVYSLIHDDLPCMDDDLVRRGKPTVHVAFDEGLAVLAGNALLARAFSILAAPPPEIDPARALAALADLSEAADSHHLMGGQADDLAFRVGGNEAERVESVHRRKSAALIVASVVAGARYGSDLASDEGELLPRLRRYGENVGVAFQIADDILDGDGEEPCSLVRVLGRDAARDRSEELLRAALREIEELDERAEPLRELARFAVRRDR